MYPANTPRVVRGSTGRVGREQPCQFHGAVAVSNLAPSRILVSSAAATRLARACTLPLSTLAHHRGTRQPLAATAKCGLECKLLPRLGNGALTSISHLQCVVANGACIK